MHQWSWLLINVCLVTGHVIHGQFEQVSNVTSEGPRKQGAFLDPDGNLILIDAGDVGLYPTGMYDDSIDYVNDVKFFLYTRDNPDDAQQLYLNDLTSVEQSNLKSTRLTKIVIHGFENNLKSPMIQEIKNAFVENYDYNVIAVDWSPLACDIIYSIVVSEVPAVGQYVGEFVEFLVANVSLNLSEIHIIGHSLGAHVSGFAGKYVQTLGLIVPRITGLDPALPGYSLDEPTKRLAITDADFVDCIHTCAGFLGFSSPICKSDFYPNDGTDPQPGCSILDFGVCSHGKSYRYFASSIYATHVFTAHACQWTKSDKPTDCTSNTALMGYPDEMQKNKTQFYLTTTANYPYSE